MVGYSLGVMERYGFATLITYLRQLGATWYSSTQVGHGRER